MAQARKSGMRRVYKKRVRVEVDPRKLNPEYFVPYDDWIWADQDDKQMSAATQREKSLKRYQHTFSAAAKEPEPAPPLMYGQKKVEDATLAKEEVEDATSSHDSESSTSSSSTEEEEELEAAGFLSWLWGSSASNSKYAIKPGKPTEKQLQKVFKVVDSDESGVLSLDEFKECLRRLGLQNEQGRIVQQFESIDKDKSGYLDYDEFRTAILGPENCKRLSVAKLWVIFDELDVDGSGALDLKEFKKASAHLGFAENENPKKYFKRVDTDGSGMVSFTEFVVAMTGSQPTAQEMQDIAELTSSKQAPPSIEQEQEEEEETANKQAASPDPQQEQEEIVAAPTLGFYDRIKARRK